MLKTPVSILQEYIVQRRLPIPEYESSGSGPSHNMSFVCTVNVGTQKAIGLGKTKKDAKQNAASKLLESFGVNTKDTQQMSNICLLPVKIKTDTPAINYIGKLNEFSASHRYPQPQYEDSDILYNAQFGVICAFLEFSTKGFGTTKKDAKQDAAKNMLLLIKENGDRLTKVKETVKPKVLIFDQDNQLLEKVMQIHAEKMKSLSLSSNSHNSNNNNNIEGPVKLIYIDTWDELMSYMDKQGWHYEVTVFQPSPLMLSLKINEHTLLNTGLTRKEIYKKFVINVVEMLEKGTDFSEPLIKF